jgi:predicted enzyme related to lactoylglutathione lyase
MGTRLVNVVIDAARPREVAAFWAELLGWEVAIDLAEEVDVRAPAPDGWALDLTFVPVPEAKRVKNRIHLDLASASAGAQQAMVDRALVLGARPADIGQAETPWVVLADPEGNEFCVLDPRPKYRTTGAVAAIVVDAHDPPALAAFWTGATGWAIEDREEGVVGLHAPDGRGPWLEFLRTADVKTVKNRIHLDVAPRSGGEISDAVRRLADSGAAVLESGDLPWQVLTDPEGNEFCVLPAR